MDPPYDIKIVFVQKITFVLRKPTNSRKLLPPELHFSNPICITSFVGWQQFLTVCWFFAKNKCNFLHKNNDDDGRVVYITCRLYTPDPLTVLTGIGADFRFEVPGQSSLGLIGGGRGQWLGGGTMASAEHEPIIGSKGRALGQRVRGRSFHSHHRSELFLFTVSLLVCPALLARCTQLLLLT